jgi:hypothetical protein
MSRPGIYVLFEGLADTVIDSQVLLHAADMRRHGIVDFEIWCVAGSSPLYERSLPQLAATKRLPGLPVRVFRGVRPSLPGSALVNALLLWLRMRRISPAFELVHARTDYSAAVCYYLKLFRSFDLIWDCRGDTEAEFRKRYAGGGPLRAAIRSFFIVSSRWRLHLATRACERAIFVTEALRKRVGKGHLQGRSEIIPCAASEALFFFSPELRAETRNELGYVRSDRVVIYSGGLAIYQCFRESVQLFRDLLRGDPNLRLLVLTPAPEAARRDLESLPTGSYQLRSARFEEVNAFLNAADYALLLRQADPLNAVAFPTKFAEYGLAGLPVIMADTVPGPHGIAKEVGNLCEYRDGTAQLVEGIDRARVSAAYRGRLSRSAVRAAFRRVYARPA